MLRHTEIQATQIHNKILDQKISHAMQQLRNKLQCSGELQKFEKSEIKIGGHYLCT